MRGFLILCCFAAQFILRKYYIFLITIRLSDTEVLDWLRFENFFMNLTVISFRISFLKLYCSGIIIFDLFTPVETFLSTLIKGILHIQFNSVLFIKRQITINAISWHFNNAVQFKPTGVRFIVIIIHLIKFRISPIHSYRANSETISQLKKITDCTETSLRSDLLS